MIHIHLFCWQPTPYNDVLFRALSADPEVEMTVHFRSRKVPSHPWRSDLAHGYRARYYNCIVGVDWHALSLVFKEKEAFFLIAGWNHPTSFILINLLCILNRRFALWTDTPDITSKRNYVFNLLRSSWLKWVFSRAHRIMGTGKPAVDALMLMGAPKEKLNNLPYVVNLYDLATAAVKRQYQELRPIRFVSSGRLINRKGHDIALQALSIASQKICMPFKYCIAGTGPDKERLENLARELGIHKYVSFPGWLEPKQIEELFINSDVLLHPSSVHEPFGVAILEGMAAGLAVLASDVCGAAIDRIDSGENGYIHPAGDVTALTEQIESLFRNPKKIRTLGMNARVTAEQWPVERAVKIIIDTIKSS